LEKARHRQDREEEERGRPCQTLARVRLRRDDRLAFLTTPERLQLDLDVPSGLPTRVRVFGETGAHDAFESSRSERRPLGQRARLIFEDCGDETGRGATLDGALAGGHLIEHETECEDIGARVRLGAFELLRRHVLDGADDAPLGGEATARGRGRREIVLARRQPGRLGEPEIESFAPDFVRMTLPGFRSRWTIPWPWAV
jgi:hypothetical protein